MAIVLLIVGLLVTAAGFVTIGFGIPINAFSLGNTLIISGTIGVASGLILIGLAAALGQLRRMADVLTARSAGRPARMAEAAEGRVAPVVAAQARPPAPLAVQVPIPAQVEPPEAAAQVEPRLPPAPEPAGPLDWLRARPKPPGSAPPVPPAPPEQPVVEVLDEAPLSPRPAPRPATAEPAIEPKVWSPSRPGTAEPKAPSPIPRATPQPEPPREKHDFDLVWPDRSPPSADSVRREEPAVPPPPLATPPRPRMPERRPEPPKPAAERGPAILKSGVIDGMPYTLYADGSIEAELPQGTVKFASVDALRAHLEKQS